MYGGTSYCKECDDSKLQTIVDAANRFDKESSRCIS